MDVIDQAKKELMDIQSKKVTKSQQKKECRSIAQTLVHEEQKHAQEEAKLEKQKKGTKVVHFNL